MRRTAGGREDHPPRTGGPSFVLFLVAVAAAGCASLHTPLPLTDAPPAVPSSSSVVAGHARAFRFEKGTWAAAPEYDYDFLVLERRFADHWDAVKEIHRLHPNYNGRAGPRDQTLYFSVRFSPAEDGGHDLVATSTLGSGRGHERPGGEGFVLELTYAKKAWFIPFDTVRVRQDRPASSGRLQETIELFAMRDGLEVPYMKMEEEGLVYRPALP